MTFQINSYLLNHQQRLGFMAGLALLLTFFLPAVTWADSPEPCAKCHPEEATTWQSSPHAQSLPAAVQCEDCHGAYVPNHPDESIMQLGVDSEVCRTCHTDTFTQWENSSHGQAGVQCISCHLSHSQRFRLTDQTLCLTCHRRQLNDFAHTTHTQTQLACTDCHLSTANSQPGGQVHMTGENTPANHSFTVTAQVCVDCHAQQTTQSRFLPIGPGNPPDNSNPDSPNTDLQVKLDNTEQFNQDLKGLALTSLGLGLGLGGMLGIIFVLVTVRTNQRRVSL